ncbi:MAG: nitroreductase family protein [Eubacteriales bacterium]
MERDFNYDIMDEIKLRWSARALDSAGIPREEIMALIEAARYAPSCFNEQPWRFLIADEEDTLEKMRSVLTPSNRTWAGKAPVLLLLAAKKDFTTTGKDNFWHSFDAGTAWGFLSLEAQRRGLIAHAMGGFDDEAAAKSFGISDEYEVLTIIAVGHPGNPDDLSPELQKREQPGTRKPAEELLLPTKKEKTL